jgi:hypothetical protein
LDLQLHQRIRLINCIRESVRSTLIPHKSSPGGSFQILTPEAIENLTGPESFLTSDDFLIRVIEDDPLLRAYTLSPRLSHHTQIQQNRKRTTGQTKKTFSAAMNNLHLPPIYLSSFLESSSSKRNLFSFIKTWLNTAPSSDNGLMRGCQQRSPTSRVRLQQWGRLNETMTPITPAIAKMVRNTTILIV